jgi:hypothetical protein
MRKRWYFTLKKGSGKASVELYLSLINRKFYTRHYLHSTDLMNWFEAHWYWFLFNRPRWIKRNASMFGYTMTIGTVHLRRLDDEMLN